MLKICLRGIYENKCTEIDDVVDLRYFDGSRLYKRRADGTCQFGLFTAVSLLLLAYFCRRRFTRVKYGFKGALIGMSYVGF